MRVALLGGVYNNYLALEAVCRDAIEKQVDKIYCLGDLGAFGPFPNRVFPILEKFNVETVQGNYDDSVGRDLEDCQCGYTDPTDNHFAHLSYQYTLGNTSPSYKKVLNSFPKQIRLDADGKQVLLCHGSPRRVNEFLWETTTPAHLLDKFCKEYKADIICASHTGLHWKRQLPGGKWFVNVGVIGRPANDGRTNVWYTVLDTDQSDPARFIPVEYDWRRLAQEMEIEKIPAEFVETIRTGYWTTCLEILPGKERARGKW
jgi:predicted phosphodiesterase